MPENTTNKSYQTVRIYKKDYEKLRELAYFEKKNIVELVQEAVQYLDKKYQESTN